MFAALSFALVLPACDQAPRSLSVVDEAEDTGEAATWRPPDTSDSAAAPGEPTQSCAADLSWEEGDLDLLGCVRLSPEVGDEADTGIPLDSGVIFPPSAPPPCGYYNLVGAVDLAGEATRPDVLYCDADDDGGLRHARWDASSGQLESTLLLPETCWVDFMTGVLTGTAEAPRAWWVELASIGDTSVWTARLDGAGGFSETPIPVEGTEGARRVVVLDSDETRLVVHDMDGQVSLLDPSAGRSSAIAEGVWAFGAAAAGPGLVVASCDESALALTVTGLDLEGEVVWSRAIDGASCGFLNSPAVSGDAGRVAITWDDADEGSLVLLDGAGEELARSGLGKGSLYPVASVGEDAVWTVDGAGLVSRWSRDGSLEGTWVHKGISGLSGSPAGLRLRVSEDALTFTLIGMDSEAASVEGHINTFYYIETSVSTVPSL